MTGRDELAHERIVVAESLAHGDGASLVLETDLRLDRIIEWDRRRLASRAFRMLRCCERISLRDEFVPLAGPFAPRQVRVREVLRVRFHRRVSAAVTLAFDDRIGNAVDVRDK